MNFIAGVFVALIIGGTIGTTLGMINNVLTEFGIQYYWQAVWLGAFTSAVMLHVAMRNGWKWRSDNRFFMPVAQIVASIFSLPIVIGVFLPTTEITPFLTVALPVGVPVMVCVMFVSGAAGLIEWSPKSDQGPQNKLES
jgi:hypothetical protein